MNCFSLCPRFFLTNAPCMLFCKALEQNEEWNIFLRCLSKSLSLVLKYALNLFSSYLGIYHPTTECFQMCQRCLKWFSLRFRSLFALFGAGQKTTYPFGCVKGTLDNVCKVLVRFSVSSETVSTPMAPDEISRTWNSRIFIRSIEILEYVLSL